MTTEASAYDGASSNLVGISISTFSWEADDKTSGCDDCVTIWQPTDIPSGYFMLGQSATQNYNNPPSPSIVTFVFKENDSKGHTCLVKGKNAQAVFKSGHLTMYIQEAPPNYIAIGSCAVPTPTTEWMCVRSDLCVSVPLGGPIWENHSSGFFIYRLPNSGLLYATKGSASSAWDIMPGPWTDAVGTLEAKG